MRKRKLLSHKALTALEARTDLGVPLAEAMRQLRIDMSRPAVAKLIKWLKDSEYYAMECDMTITMSLFPNWLDKDCMVVQEEPDNWSYTGRFPHGEWYGNN